jgi:hypothetical protein
MVIENVEQDQSKREFILIVHEFIQSTFLFTISDIQGAL